MPVSSLGTLHGFLLRFHGQCWPPFSREHLCLGVKTAVTPRVDCPMAESQDVLNKRPSEGHVPGQGWQMTRIMVTAVPAALAFSSPCGWRHCRCTFSQRTAGKSLLVNAGKRWPFSPSGQPKLGSAVRPVCSLLDLPHSGIQAVAGLVFDLLPSLTQLKLSLSTHQKSPWKRELMQAQQGLPTSAPTAPPLTSGVPGNRGRMMATMCCWWTPWGPTTLNPGAWMVDGVMSSPEGMGVQRATGVGLPSTMTSAWVPHSPHPDPEQLRDCLEMPAVQ